MTERQAPPPKDVIIDPMGDGSLLAPLARLASEAERDDGVLQINYPVQPPAEDAAAGQLAMRALGELLIAASRIPRSCDGMRSSATGALSIAARSLEAMAEPFEPGADAAAEHADRLDDHQPRSAAWTLQTMERHARMLREAVERRDAARVGEIVALYVFD